MALATTLYIQHGKAKAKATEVSTQLGQLIGRTIPIEYDWKFVDQAAFKTIPVDQQKALLVDTLGKNLTECLLGAQDSLAAACAASPPVRDIVATITKLFFSYDYANTIAAPTGVNFLNIFLEGTVLHFKCNLNAVQQVNNGDWGVMAKLLAMVGSPAVLASTASPQAPVSVTIAPAATAGVVASPSVSAAPVAVQPVSMPAASAASAPASTSAYARVGGKPGGNGTSTFLYMTLDKLKKRSVELGNELSARLGGKIEFTVDLNTLAKDSTFTKESEVDQKAILTNICPSSWAGALFEAADGSSTIEAALRAQPGPNKVKWAYAPSTTPTPGWGFLEVNVVGSEILIKCAVANADAVYGAVAAGVPASAPVASAPVVAAPMAVPLAAVAPTVVSTPTPASPATQKAPAMLPAPVAVQSAPVAQPVAAAASPQPAAPPTGPVPGGRFPLAGGKAGGNGTTGFLYTPLEKLKKTVNDTYNKEFAKLLGSARVSVVLDHSFAKHASFTKHSEADQRSLVLGPIMDNIANVLYNSPNGDHMVALFRDPKFLERTVKITKITFQLVSDVTSSEGFPACDMVWCDNGTEIQFRVDIESIDHWFDPDTWSVTKKAHEGIFGIEKRAAEAAKLLEQRKAMAALEAKAAANAAEAEKLAAEQRAAAAKIAEQERLRKEHEAGIEERIKTLEDSGVTPKLRENNDRLRQFLGMVSVSGEIEYNVDNLFIHDRKLRWRDCGTQKTTLKSISIEPWSLFNILTDASIAILESGEVGQQKLMQTYSKFNLQFEVGEANIKVPRLVYDPETKTLNIFATFSNIYDPRKWIEELTKGVSEKQIYGGTTIVEYFKAILAYTGGWLEDMARDEATTLINNILDPYFKKHFEGRVVPIECDWKSLDGYNAKENLIVRLKKHYQFPPRVLEVLFKSFDLANSVVMSILRAKLQKIRVVASNSDGVTLENGGETMIITYKYSDQNCAEKQWKGFIEDQVRQRCTGLIVKNVSAEIAMAEAAPTLLELNRTLVAKLGMTSANGGYDVLVVDYPTFVDTLEFNKMYGVQKFAVLHNSNLETLKSLVRGFEEVSRSKLGGPLLKTVKKIHVTLDVKSKDNTDDALLAWDSTTKTFTVTHSFHSFEHPGNYVYTPRIEYVMGILIESCRLETKTIVDKFYQTVRTDFCLNSLPVLIDESYQTTKEFTSIHPSKMKAIVMRMFTHLPPSIFHGDMGIKHCTEFPKARQILHDKVKSIRLLPDGMLASNTSKVELEKGELLVRVAYDCQDWTTPIGYRLSEMIGSRPTIEQEVMDEIDHKLIAFTELLRSKTKNSKITVKVDWKELLADTTFQTAQNYVNDYVRYMLEKVKIAFEGTKSTFDAGLTHYLQDEQLAPHMSNLESLVFHLSTSNSVSTTGKFGLFTPYYYDVTQTGKDLHVRLNYMAYPVGVGSIVEWVVNPSRAQERQNQYIKTISVRNYNEEMQRRADEIEWAHESNRRAQDQYNRDVDQYNRDMQAYAAKPNTKNCTWCNGKGYRSNGRCSSCNGRGWEEVRKTPPTMPTTPIPRPIPTFPPATVADFTIGLHRGELREDHYVEGRDDPKGKSKKGKKQAKVDDDDI